MHTAYLRSLIQPNTLMPLTLLLVAAYTPAYSNTPQAKISNGVNASTAEWPWMIALVYPNTSSIRCGGSLVAKDWIVTAAHCVYNATAKRVLRPNELDVLVNRTALQSQAGERMSIAQINMHADYNPQTFEHDIALIKLSKPTDLAPLEILAEYNDLDSPGAIITALGWGFTSAVSERSGITANILQKVSFPLLDNSTCQRYFSSSITNSMLCGGVPDGKRNTCSGDSGSPLIIFNPERNIWQQVGLTSFGKNAPCGSARAAYGVYTRVKSYKAYISDTICSTSDIPSIPQLQKTVNGSTVTLTWNRDSLPDTQYLLTYQAYNDPVPHSLDLHDQTRFAIDLPPGSHYFVWLNAYRSNCTSAYTDKNDVIVL